MFVVLRLSKYTQATATSYSYLGYQLQAVTSFIIYFDRANAENWSHQGQYCVMKMVDRVCITYSICSC